MEIVLVSCLKYDPLQLEYQTTEKNIKIFFYSRDWEKHFLSLTGKEGRLPSLKVDRA